MAQGKEDDTRRTVIADPLTQPPRTPLPETRISDPSPPTRPVGSEPGNQTRIVFRGAEIPQRDAAVVEPTAPMPERDSIFALPNGPVVGWLVVVVGPGRGRAKEIYIGMNTIGREPQNRIVLDFGDTSISRGKAAAIAYDPVVGNFTVMPGEGTNIVRHNTAAVYGPQPMAAGDTLMIGQTELRFVPLCGPDFQWEQS